MSSVSMGDMTFATKLRTLVMQLAGEAIDKMRPRPRYGVVYTIDRPGKRAQVILNGDLDPVSVSLGAIQPKMAGQVVRVEGIGFDKYVTDVVGGVIYWGNVEIDASQVTGGVFAPARMAHVNSDSTTRAWFTTDPLGGWGGAHTTLAMSPPTDASWTNALELRVNNVVRFAVDKSGVLATGTVPAERIDKFTSAANYTNLLATAGSVVSGWVFQVNNGAGTAGLIHDNAWKVQWNTAGDMLVGRVPTARLTGLVGYSNLPHIVSNPAASPPYMILGVDQSVSYDTQTTSLRMQNRSGATTGERFAIYDASRKVLLHLNRDSTGDYAAAQAFYDRTTTAAANVQVGTSGALSRSTSLRAAKVSIEDAPESWAEKVWSLRPRTWFDKGDADLVAEALDRTVEGEDVDWSEVVASPLRRIPGFVAEEVGEAGLEEFLIRDEAGELTGLAYDRFSAALLVAMKDEREKRIAAEERVDALEGAVADLESKLHALATHLGVNL